MTDRKHTAVIQGLRDNILVLQDKRDWDDYAHEARRATEEAITELEGLRAENERLREALKEAREALGYQLEVEISASAAESLEATITQIDAALSKAEGSAA